MKTTRKNMIKGVAATLGLCAISGLGKTIKGRPTIADAELMDVQSGDPSIVYTPSKNDDKFTILQHDFIRSYQRFLSIDEKYEHPRYCDHVRVILTQSYFEELNSTTCILPSGKRCSVLDWIKSVDVFFIDDYHPQEVVGREDGVIKTNKKGYFLFGIPRIDATEGQFVRTSFI